MKRFIFGLTFLATMFAGCQTEPLNEPLIVGSSVFDASTEVFVPQTKTSMTSDRLVVWSRNDRLAIFQGSTVADEYLVSDASVGNTNATFNIVTDNKEINGSFSAGTEVACNIAFYPYSANLSLASSALDDNKTLFKIVGYELPETQQYVPGSFGEGSFPMIAVTEAMSDHTLRFKNVLGAMKLQFKGTQNVVAINVTGKNNEKLSGDVIVTAYADGTASSVALMGSGDASQSVTLDCGDGVQLSEDTATEFILALPPVCFRNGFVVKVVDVHGNEYVVESEKQQEILRSCILVMPEVYLEGDSDETDDMLKITTTDAGTLKDLLSDYDTGSIKNLSIAGPIDARDFNFIKWNCLNLENIDISETTIEYYYGDQGTNEGYCDVYPENEIPLGAFFYWISNYGDRYSDEGMPTLKSVMLPPTIKTIRRNAFARAYRLTGINFPEGLEAIDFVALSFCTSLEMVELPSTLKEIGLWAFHNMNALKEVHCKAVVPPSLEQSFCWIGDWSGVRGLLDYSFYNPDPSAILYVPEGSLLAYQSSEWADFFDRIIEE